VTNGCDIHIKLVRYIVIYTGVCNVSILVSVRVSNAGDRFLRHSVVCLTKQPGSVPYEGNTFSTSVSS